MILNGGTVIGANIISTNASHGGGAIRTNANFNMYGGTVYGGRSLTNGDNVYVSGGTASLCGGTIAGGVDIAGGTLKMDGNPVVDKALTPAGYDMPSYSLRLAAGKKITVVSAADGARILITASVGSEIAENVEDPSFFSCDEPSMTLIYDSSLKKLTMSAS